MPPLGEIAKCGLCGAIAYASELELNRLNWEYQCKDYDACLTRKKNKDRSIEYDILKKRLKK